MTNETKKYGRFRVARESLAEIDIASVVFEGFIPYKVEYLVMYDELVCEGYHSDFTPVPCGQQAPEYTALIRTYVDSDTQDKIYKREWIA